MEKYPLNKDQLKQAYQLFKAKWPQLSLLCNELIEQYPDDFNSINNQGLNFELLNGHFAIKLIINDACQALKLLLPDYENSIEAWYLDGFAPTKNPQMWTAELFKLMSNLSQKDATLSTFTAAGFVRRGLTDAGFELSKAPGFGKKRELLYGKKV